MKYSVIVSLLIVFVGSAEVAAGQGTDESFYCGYTNTDGTGQDYSEFGKGTDFKFNNKNNRWEWVSEYSAQYIYPNGRYEQISKLAGNQVGVCNSEMEKIYKQKIKEIMDKHRN
ncbi:MAG: hypothetical protein ACQ9ET_05210 [Nitrosomonadaceae bacterium]